MIFAPYLKAPIGNLLDYTTRELAAYSRSCYNQPRKFKKQDSQSGIGIVQNLEPIDNQLAYPINFVLIWLAMWSRYD